MYKRIIFSKTLPVKSRLKNLIAYFLRRRGARILWNEAWGELHKATPAYGRPADKAMEREHQAYWKAFRRKTNPFSLRIGFHISGKADPRCLPEEILMTDIEPTLNGTEPAVFLSNKSMYNHWFGGGIFPEDYLHNIDGDWMDRDFNSVSFEQVASIARGLDYPVVLKPNRDTFGGAEVFFPKSSEELIPLLQGRTNVVVQEKLTQHPFYEKYNPHGINSVRVNIYRSVTDNRLHAINIAMRAGRGGSLDNLTSGGIGVMVRPDGMMDGYALDGKGRKYFHHPDTGHGFDVRIPAYEELVKVSLELARKVLYTRIICLDMCYDDQGRWRAVELNINGTTLMFAQFHGVPFFNQFTDEVRDYCIKHHWALKK